MLDDGVSLIPVLIVVVLLNLLFLQLVLFHHELTVRTHKHQIQTLSSGRGECVFKFEASLQTAPVRVLDDAPVDPLLQYFKVRDAGCFGEVETQLLSLAVSGVVEGSIMKKT